MYASFPSSFLLSPSIPRSLNQYELRKKRNCLSFIAFRFMLNPLRHSLTRMLNPEPWHPWLLVRVIGTSNDFPTIRMDSGIGALACAVAVGNASYVCNSHFHALQNWCSMRALFLRSTGCLACWCPGVIHAQNRRRVEYLNVHGIPEPERHRLFGTDSILYALLECCGHMGWILQVSCLMFRAQDHFLTTRASCVFFRLGPGRPFGNDTMFVEVVWAIVVHRSYVTPAHWCKRIGSWSRKKRPCWGQSVLEGCACSLFKSGLYTSMKDLKALEVYNSSGALR